MQPNPNFPIKKPGDDNPGIDEIGYPIQINIANRLASAVVDHFAMTFIIGIVSFPFIVYQINQKVLFCGGFLFYGFVATFCIYFCKDCIGAQSIGKRFLKQQVVVASTGQPAGPIRCVIRNILTMIWPIEVIVILFSPSRRIGDFIAGTRIAPALTSLPNETPNYLQIALGYLIGYATVILLFSLIFTGCGIFT